MTAGDDRARRMQAAARVLAAGGKVEAAARSAGVSTRTLRRWRPTAAFRAIERAAQSEAEAAGGDLARERGLYAAMLAAAERDPAGISAAKIRALSDLRRQLQAADQGAPQFADFAGRARDLCDQWFEGKAPAEAEAIGPAPDGLLAFLTDLARHAPGGDPAE